MIGSVVVAIAANKWIWIHATACGKKHLRYCYRAWLQSDVIKRMN